MRLRRRNNLALLSLAALVAMVAAGCAHKSSDTYQGYVEGKFVYVASPQSGRLDQLSVTRGETIGVSHPLFALDGEPEASAERQAQQLLRVSEAKLADLRTGKRPPEVDVTQAQLLQALADKKQADEILKSDEKQYGAGGIPLTDLINARGSRRVGHSQGAATAKRVGGGRAACTRAADQGADRASGCRPRCLAAGGLEAATEGDCFPAKWAGLRHPLSPRRMGCVGQSGGPTPSSGECGSALLCSRGCSRQAQDRSAR